MSPEIEPARLEEPTGPIADVIAELAASAATLGKALHPSSSQTSCVRYYEERFALAGMGRAAQQS